MSPITTTRHGDILIVTSNNPPVNALGHAVRVDRRIVGGDDQDIAVAGCGDGAHHGLRYWHSFRDRRDLT